jgi:hypothetical protein
MKDQVVAEFDLRDSATTQDKSTEPGPTSCLV